MIKKEVKIKGITYQVSANTEAHALEVIQMLRKTLKTDKKKDTENGNGI